MIIELKSSGIIMQNRNVYYNSIMPKVTFRAIRYKKVDGRTLMQKSIAFDNNIILREINRNDILIS